MSLTDDFLKSMQKRGISIQQDSGSKLTAGDDLTSEFLNSMQKRKKKAEEDILADIAPVGMTTTKNDDERKWFELGLFEDGWDKGDLWKTVLGTLTDVSENAAAGVLGMGEKALDAFAYGSALLSQNQSHSTRFGDMFKSEEMQQYYKDSAAAYKKKTEAFIKKDLYDEEEVAKKLILGTDKNSVLGEKSDALVQSGGQLLATAGLQAVGVPWFLTTGATSFGGQVETAMNEGASYGKAGLSAVVSAGAEILTEKLSGGIKFGGKALDDALVKTLSRKISDKTVRTMAKFGLDTFGEGTEEVISQVFSNLGSSIYKEESIGELLTSEQAMDEYLESFIGGAVLGGGSSVVGAVKANKKGVDAVSGLTANEQKVVDHEYQKRIAEEEKNGKITERQKSKIYDEVLSEMDKGYISADTIEEVLGGETYKTHSDTIAREKSLQEEYDKLYQMKNGDKSDAQIDRQAELKKQLEDIKQNFNRDQLGSEVMSLVKNDRLAESYNERSRRGQAYQADISKYDVKQQATIQKAIDSGILNNTNRTHEFVDMIAKITADKGVPFDFTNNEKLKNSGFAVDGKAVNGYVTKDGVTLNIDSAKSMNSVVGHEITHVLEGTELYNTLQNVVTEYAKGKGDYQSRYDALTKLYEGVEGADINSELTADLVGDYLFTDTDFVRNLSVQHRNVFQKIYDEIKYLCKVATAGSKEARELEKVKRAFEEAYKADGKGQSDTKYSLTDTDGVELSKEQQEYFKDSKVRDENGNLKVMYHGTPNGDFTVFKDGTYFTNNKAYADRYQSPSASSISSGKTATNPKTFEVYLDIKKPFDITDAEARDIYVNEYIKGGNAIGINPYLSDAEYDKIETIDWTEGEDLRDFLIDNEYDYDGLVLDEGADGGYGDEVSYRGKSYVVFSPEQVKNIDNQSPTSDPDIRFSLSEPVEETKDLVAVHNLHAAELSETLKLSGLPSPSVAIIKAKDGHEKYGDVTLILPKDAIDPQANKANRIYGSDAWTPTRSNAQVEYEVDYDKQRQFERNIEQLANGVANGVFSKSSVLGMAGIEGSTNLNLNEIARKISDYDAVQAAYVAETGGNVDVVYRAKEFDTYGNKALKNYIDGVGEQEVARLAVKMLTGERLSTEEIETAKDAIVKDWTAKKEYTLKQKPELREIRIAKFREKVTNLRTEDFIRHAWEFYEDSGATTDEIDRGATGNNLRAAANRADVEEWVAEKLQGLLGEPGIYNGKDLFTPSGRSRSFKETHWEYTAENIVRAMNNADARGANVWNVSGEAIIATATSEYKNIDEVRADKDRLSKADDDYYEQIKDDISEELEAVTKDIIRTTEHISDNQYDEEQIIGRVIMDAAQGTKTVAGVKRVFQKNGYRIGDAQAQSVLSLFDHASKVPTGYFEAKPQRVVGFDEVGVYVIPNNADVKLKQELLNRGYSIAEYDPNIEGHRQQVVNQFEEYKFSLSNVGEQFAPANSRDVFGKDIALETAPVEEAAPVKETVAESATVEENLFPDDNFAPIYDAHPGKGVAEGQQTMFKEEPKPETEKERKQTRKQLHQSIVDSVKADFKAKGFDFDKVLKNAKNLSTFATVDNMPQRVMEKALGYAEGQALSDLTVNKVAQNETDGIKWLNSYTDRKGGLLKKISDQYHIKPGSKESAAAQMYAEGFYVDDKNNIIAYGDAELAKDFPNVRVQQNIKGLANDPRIRRIYDETLAMINASRTRNAYPEIPRLDNYFLHFRAMDDTFSKLGLPFNPNDIRAKDLPTDLNGVTADLKPGQPYFASAMHRTGKRTSFDLLGGLERYLTSAKNQIYHIDDIQTLRALRNYIADTYGQANGLEGLDALSEEEAQERIEKVYNSHLSTFAKFLNEEANILAGKTALIDRGLEGIIGRRGITFLNTVNGQVGSNMVGFNISSSLTNFLPVAQTFAKTNKFDFVKAFAQTVGNKVGSVFGRTDGFAENSPVIIRRKGSDRFYRTPWQKAGDVGYVFMSAVDDISTELIARTKYNELTRKGMDEQKAHYETDKWVSRLMGDRSLGQMPQLYNSKMLGLVTKFQLEVRNQLDSQFYDTIQEAQVSAEHIQNGLARNAKVAAKVATTFVELAVVQHLFGKAFESVAGYNPAFDIIEVLMTAFGYDDDEDSEDTVLDNVEQAFLGLLEDLPYTSTFTDGGRIPISSALPIGELIKGEDEWGNEKSRWKTLGEIAPYYLMPGGYGQVKKTKAGLDMFSDEHPIAGSYTDSGNLRFPVEDTLKNRVQAGIFGQWASENARDYFDKNRTPLKENQMQEFTSLEVSYDEYWAFRDDMNAITKRAEMKGASDEEILKSKYIDSVGSRLSDIRAEKQKVIDNPELTIAQKAEKITELNQQFADLANERYNSYNKVSIDGDYANIGSSYFQWYTPEESGENPYWRKLTDDQTTKYLAIKDVGDAHYATNGDVHYRLEEGGNPENLSDWTKISEKDLARQKKVTMELGITPEEYWRETEVSFIPMKQGEYEYAYENPENYAVAKAVGGYDAYKGYSADLSNIHADKDANGKSISGSRKSKVLDYINNLDADYYTRIILWKSEYNSDDTYNEEIIDYLNGRDDISFDETVAILRKLGFKVTDDGDISW